MSNIKNAVIVLRTLFVFLIMCAIAFSAGCSRTPSQTTKQTTRTTNNNQPEFSGVSSEPSDTGQILALAEAAYAAKDWEAAEKHYVSTTRSIPKEATPWFRLGNIYARTDRPDFAVRAYKEALLRDPEMGKAWYNMGLVQLRQSANSFLQMRTYTQDNSEAQIRADTMYEATIALIKDGPRRAKAFPYASGGTVDAPSVNVLPTVQPTQESSNPNSASEPESMNEEAQGSPIESFSADVATDGELNEELEEAVETETGVESPAEPVDATQ